MNQVKNIDNKTNGTNMLNGDNLIKQDSESIVQGILKDSISNSTFNSDSLLQSECYAAEDPSTTDSCMSLPASTMLLTAKPFKSRIPVRRGGATTPSDYDQMSTCSGRSTPTFRNDLEPMSSSYTLSSSSSMVPPLIAPKPTYIKGQLPRKLNKMTLKRETSLPPLAFRSALSLSSTSQTAKELSNVSKQGVKPKYERSNSSMSMYEERKKSRDQQQLQRLGYLPVPLSTSYRRGSIDNVYGDGGDTESVSSTRCSTPNRLMGSMSKIPIWTGSQEKLNTLRLNTNVQTNLTQKNATSNRMLPPIPTKTATMSSGTKGSVASRVKKLDKKKWESCSSLEVGIQLYDT